MSAVAYGFALIEVKVAEIATTSAAYFTDLAAANSRRRDVSPICKNGRERFVWAHGFITGMALGTGVFTIGLCVVLWIALNDKV